MIRYVEHRDIDKTKWDDCINRSENGLVYALSWYLDVVCPQWTAIIVDDYHLVMPLPVRKKYGISYIFAPLYAQQLGVFGNHLTGNILEQILNTIPHQYRIVDLKLNESNTLPETYREKSLKPNHILLLDSPVEKIQQSYNRNCRRNLNKAIESGLRVEICTQAAEFTDFMRVHLLKQVDFLHESDMDLLYRITRAALDHNAAQLLAVYDNTDQLCAMGSFLIHKKRVIFSVCASTSEGKKNQAMYLLVNHQITQCATQFEVFDFSGSELPGVAYFNTTFGARNQPYTLVRINRLPQWLQLLARK